MRFGLVLSVAGLLAGCATLPEPQRASLLQASEAYNRGDFAGATSRCSNIINAFPNAAEISEAYYIRGLCLAKSDQLLPAANDFQDAITHSLREDLTVRSQASLGAIAYRQGDWPRAAEMYETALKTLPDEPPTDQIAYACGVAMQRAGRWKDASFQFGRILRKFRDSPVATDVRRLASWSYEYFTIQLAVYSSADTATASVQTYKSRGIDAYVQSMSRDGRILWVVLSGRHPTYNEATASLGRIRQIEPKAYILP